MRPIFETIKLTVKGFNDHHATVLAGSMAYTTLFAIFPFLIFSASLTGIIIGEARSAEALQTLFSLVPDHVAKTLSPVVTEVLSERHGLFTFAIVVAIWVAMGAIESLATAFHRAYGLKGHENFFVGKGKALLAVLAASVLAVILGLLILFAPLLLELARRYIPSIIVGWEGTINVLRYGISVILFSTFLWGIHRFLPKGHVLPVLLWPGVLLTTILWMAMASGLSIYLTYAGSYTVTYGTLAGVIITMLFLYLSGLIVILGAEFNAAISAGKKRIV